MGGTGKFGAAARVWVFIFGLPFAAVGMCMGYLMLSMLMESQHIIGSWPVIPAQIISVDLEKKSGSKGATTYKVLATYRYDYNGKTYTNDRVALNSMRDNIGSFHERKYDELRRYFNNKTPYRIFVNPDKPQESILFPGVRWELFVFYAVFFGIFGLLGLGMILGAFIGRGRDKEQALLKERYPRDPWMHRLDWQKRRIMSGSKLTLMVLIFISVIWNAISLPVLFAVPKELESGEYMILVALIFPLIGLGFIYFTLRAYLRWRRFGNASFNLETLPAWTGEKLRGHILSGAAVPENVEVELLLKCCSTRTTSSGGKTRTTTEDVWKQEKKISLRASPGSSRQSTIPVEFEIPHDAHPCSVGDANPQISWKLEAHARLSGADFAADFEVPVFKREQNSIPTNK